MQYGPGGKRCCLHIHGATNYAYWLWGNHTEELEKDEKEKGKQNKKAGAAPFAPLSEPYEVPYTIAYEPYFVLDVSQWRELPYLPTQSLRDARY